MHQPSPRYRLTTKTIDEVVNASYAIEREMRDLIDAKPRRPGTQPPQEEAHYYDTLESDWQSLSERMSQEAKRTWQDLFGTLSTLESRLYFGRKAGNERNKNHSSVTIYTNIARRLIRLALEAQLYALRLRSNFDPYLNPESDQKANDFALAKAAIKKYYGTIKSWDDDLWQRTGRHYFAHQRGDTEMFKQLSRAFGADSVEPLEHGWLQVAGQVQDELRYQHYEANRRETRQPLTRLWLLVFKFVTGYGRYPALTLPFAAGIILLYTLLYQFFDVQCTGPWAAFQAAITNLAGSGTNTCGSSIGALQTTETILGYILLAIISALILDKLTESERFRT